MRNAIWADLGQVPAAEPRRKCLGQTFASQNCSGTEEQGWLENEATVERVHEALALFCRKRGTSGNSSRWNEFHDPTVKENDRLGDIPVSTSI